MEVVGLHRAAGIACHHCIAVKNTALAGAIGTGRPEGSACNNQPCSTRPVHWQHQLPMRCASCAPRFGLVQALASMLGGTWKRVPRATW